MPGAEAVVLRLGALREGGEAVRLADGLHAGAAAGEDLVGVRLGGANGGESVEWEENWRSGDGGDTRDAAGARAVSAALPGVQPQSVRGPEIALLHTRPAQMSHALGREAQLCSPRQHRAARLLPQLGRLGASMADLARTRAQLTHTADPCIGLPRAAGSETSLPVTLCHGKEGTPGGPHPR